MQEIKEKAKLKYPDQSLYTYVGSRLKKLRMWGYIEYDKKRGDKKGYYVIKEPFPVTFIT